MSGFDQMEGLNGISAIILWEWIRAAERMVQAEFGCTVPVDFSIDYEDDTLRVYFGLVLSPLLTPELVARKLDHLDAMWQAVAPPWAREFFSFHWNDIGSGRTIDDISRAKRR